MWVLGHLGIGSGIARRISRGLPIGWLLFGTVLPDLIDKPLYYGLSLATGKRGFDLGLVSCTRTFGHTAIFLVAIAIYAWARRSRAAAAVALGVGTHLVLDAFQDYWFRAFLGNEGESSALVALLFPFHLARFSEMPFASLAEHLRSVGRPFLLVSEGIGALILARLWIIERRRARLAGRSG
jgi:membrane-bound metal-dependent hydrolase YbcI (DUF457 family)